LKKSTHQIHNIEVTKVVAQSNSKGALKLYSKTRRIKGGTQPKNENEHNKMHAQKVLGNVNPNGRNILCCLHAFHENVCMPSYFHKNVFHYFEVMNST
jgi:hypothetical protein